VPCKWRQVEFVRWTKLVSQGKGVQVFCADKISNCWLRLRAKQGQARTVFCSPTSEGQCIPYERSPWQREKTPSVSSRDLLTHIGGLPEGPVESDPKAPRTV